MLLSPSTCLTLLLLASVSEGKPGPPCSSGDQATCPDAVDEIIPQGDVSRNKTGSDDALRHGGKSPDGALDSTRGGVSTSSEATRNMGSNETTDPARNLTHPDHASLSGATDGAENSTGEGSPPSTASDATNGREDDLLGDGQLAEEEEEEEEEVTLVRKCCELDQFFSLQTQSCEVAEGDTGFEERIRDLLAEEGELRYTTRRLQGCPGTENAPLVNEANFDSHSILPAGHLREHATGINYDQEHYCLELAAGGAQEVASALLVAASCQKPVDVVTRKCCDLDQYFNHRVGDCRPKTENMSDHETLVREFLKGGPPAATSIHVTSGRLLCDQGAPRIVVADEASLDSSNQLCERQTGNCFPASLYCVEYVWASGDSTMTAVASVCPRDFFHKCCPREHVLTESGCVEAPSQGAVSARMMQLLEVMDPQFGFPSGSRGEQCVQEWITPDDSQIRWWVSKSGYLSIDSRRNSISTTRYCVDDYLDPANQTQTVALMCYTELEDIMPVHLSAQPSEAASVGKCCPHNQYMSLDGYSCVQDDRGLELLQDTALRASNVTKLTYTSFPVCQSGREYHFYYLEPGSHEDHALLGEDLVIQVVSLEGKCVLSKQPFQRNHYCLEYGVDERGVRPLVLVCPDSWEGVNVHTEKFGLTVVLLGLSCAGLLATAFSLISTRVRRGLVTVKKVNTLAGRILLSYVMAYLIGFLVLAVSMKVDVAQENTECHVMAGLLMFFLLAAFQWNTSICMESLLLTLRVSTSEGRRYFYHSLWAWGVPGLITAIALTLDHYRESLPCGVITPKIGLYKCFFSDNSSKMVYLYVPMLVTLCANILLLAAARYARLAKLRRLEHGLARPRRSGGDATEMKSCDQNGSTKSKTPHQSPKPQQSGLRTHQTRNLWTESVKLVVWSGATWLLEVIGFVVTRYLVPPSESWYDYLWYLPSSVNALRGVGIFFILVLTPENRVKLSRAMGTLGSKTGISFLSRKSTMASGNSCSARNQRSSVSGGGTEVRDAGRRKVSNATTITQLSSIRGSLSTDSRPDTGHARATAHPGLAHSISQVDTRRSSQSSTSDDVEGLQLDAEVGAGGRRKPSLATFGVASLPCVDEEEASDEATLPAHPPLNTTKSASDA